MVVVTDQERLLNALANRGCSSVLRGWRRELDPDGSLDVGFQEFCQAAARMQVAVDAPQLFGTDSPESLALRSLAPAEGLLVKRFRDWLTRSFGGPGEMFMAFEAPNSDGTITRQEFIDGCIHHGFTAKQNEISEMFNLLDVDNVCRVSMEDVMFLETDKKRREGALHKARMKSKREHENLLAEGFREDSRHNLGATHRLATREWHAASLERLPALVHQKKMHQQHNKEVRMTKARTVFMQHLHSLYGNGVRAWRRGLDPDMHFALARADLGRYCRKANVEVDLDYLWKALDQHEEGRIHMQDIGPKCATVVAKFRDWACKHHGTCVSLWDRLKATVASSNKWKSDKKLLSATFLAALDAFNWPGARDAEEGAVLCVSLDYYGCGFISRHDLEWCDAWEPPLWLSVEPDRGAWMQLRALMLHTYGQPLRAWRRLLDTDDSNLVSWSEFQDACKRIRFSGNIGGAWRFLDADMSGGISLQEYDEPSANMLTSFKEWIETHWGSVEFAFRSIDSDGSGTLTYSELKRACQRRDWSGDVRQIFEYLDVEIGPGLRTLSYKELTFLDSWVPASDDVDQEVITLPCRGPTHASSSSRALRRARSSPEVGQGGSLSPCMRAVDTRAHTEALPAMLQTPTPSQTMTFRSGTSVQTCSSPCLPRIAKPARTPCATRKPRRGGVGPGACSGAELEMPSGRVIALCQSTPMRATLRAKK